jgi:hypothetical protein
VGSLPRRVVRDYEIQRTVTFCFSVANTSLNKLKHQKKRIRRFTKNRYAKSRNKKQKERIEKNGVGYTKRSRKMVAFSWFRPACGLGKNLKVEGTALGFALATVGSDLNVKANCDG